MRFIRPFIIFILGVLYIWLMGLLWFIGQIPRTPSNDDTHTDAVAVFTGSSRRIELGLDILAAGKADKLFISGVANGVTIDDLYAASRDMKVPDGVIDIKDIVVLGYDANNTRGNAIETAGWMKKEGYSSLRLVTANYHMPRAMAELQQEMPDVTLIAEPAFPQQFKREEWWKFPGTAQLIISEYHKYIAVELDNALKNYKLEGQL